MSGAASQIERFVPELARRRIALSGASDIGVDPQQLPAAVVFADVSGFARLAQSLAGLEASGAEQLTKLLNTYYGALVDLIINRGGDVVRFSGDALLAVWPADASWHAGSNNGAGRDEGSPDLLALQVERAAEACLETQRRLTGFEVAPEVRLSLRMSVAAGEITVCHLGGVGGSWQLAVLGQPLEQLWRADRLCPVGSVVLSPDAVRAAGSVFRGLPAADGNLILQSLTAPPACTPLPRVALEGSAWQRLRGLVPAAVTARIDSGLGQWLADLLRVTAVFLRLTWPDRDTPPGAAELQTAMCLLQTAALRYRGTVLQLMLDDKGTVGIVGFGLPPYEGEDCAMRALRMAAALAEPLADAGMQADVGMAAGPAFCGPLGSDHHQQYTVMGNVMNLAARLMQQARGDVLCDEAVQREAAGRMEFQSLPRYRLKGFADPQAVCRLLRSEGPTRGSRQLFGRQQQCTVLRQALEDTLAGGNVDVVVEGEPGVGKSALIRAMLDLAVGLGMTPLLGECSLVEQSTPYFPWRQVFSNLLDIEKLADPAARQAAVLRNLPEEQHRIAALLNPLLAVELPETEIVRQLSGTTRADNLHELLIGLLASAVQRRGPLAIVLDDMQWADSTSWQLASLVIQRIRPLTLGLFLRTLPEPHPPAYTELLALPEVRRVKMELLSPADTAALARHRLGVERVAARVSDLVYQRSQGNPFFAEEVINLLRDTGGVVVHDGLCDLAGDQPDVVPRRVNDLITSRVNQLPPPERLALQVASVVGRVFPGRLLAEVYPVQHNRGHLDQYLNSLQRHDLVRVESQQPDIVYAFRHVTIQQVTYNQIPQGQRSSLHRAIASWYEHGDGVVAANYPLLAWHWGAAEDLEQELFYLDLAGDEALRTGAGREAVRLYEKARNRLLTARGTEIDDDDRTRLAHWTRLLGEAHFQLGDLVEGRRVLEEALHTLGHHVPATSTQTRISTLGQVLVQCGHRLRRLRARKGTGSLTTAEYRTLEASLASQRISQICYFTNDIEVGIDRALHAMNLAEGIQESPGLAIAYTNMCIVAALLRIDSLARLYARLAEKTGRSTGHLASLTYALTGTNMYWMGRGNWNKVRHGCREAIDICEQLGDQRQLTEAVTVLAMLTCFLGRFDESLEHFDRVRQLGEKTHNILHRAWGHCGRGECLLRLERHDEALAELETAWQLLENRKDRTEEIRAAGLLALAHWQQGHESPALGFAGAVGRLITESAHITASTLEGVAGMAEVQLRAWQRAPDDPALAADARLAVRRMARYGSVFPIGRPRAARLQGLAEAIAGRLAVARRHWQRSLQLAQQFGLDLEARLTQHEIDSTPPA